MKRALFCLALALLFSACSSAKVRILPGANGVNKVVSSDHEKEDAEEAAIKEANNFCEKQKRRMYVVKENKTNYNGSMNENTRKGVRSASQTAAVLGGGILGDAGMAGYSMTSNHEYEAKFFFTCR
ncbi:MAG: hypothetical protein AB7K68_07170 [Bacteriovoracia bacterium]